MKKRKAQGKLNDFSPTILNSIATDEGIPATQLRAGLKDNTIIITRIL